MDFLATHRSTLDRAIAAIGRRDYWSAYPETPSGKIYGASAKADAEATFQAMLGKPFALDQDAPRSVGAEVSPWGPALGITYPAAEPDALVASAKAAAPAWADASPEARAGIALEILARLNRDSFLMANAVMHTTGQSFVMAFQAGGPHAQDRGLEAVAYAVEELARVPGPARWSKSVGKETLVLDKSFEAVPRGVGLVIGCATFPTWNGYPGLFASLVTGNAVIVVASEQRPIPAVTLSEVLATSDVPGGVVNVLTGFTKELAPPLASHLDVNAIDLAGAVGAEGVTWGELEAAAADSVKRVLRPAVGRRGDDAEPDWTEAPRPQRILAFTETKTVWHPKGV